MLWIGFAAAALAGILWYMIAPARNRAGRTDALTGRAFAHRGLHSDKNAVPENSLKAFALAARQGYGVELDVRLSADGVPVVIHDESLQRMSGIDRRVDALSWGQLRTVHLARTEECVPSLAQALEAVGGKTPVLVELKPGNGQGQTDKLCEAAWKELREYQGSYAVQSFDPRVLGWFRRHAPAVTRGQLSTKLRGDSGLSPLNRILLTGLFCNFISRPHYIAYEHLFLEHWSLQICVRYLGAALAVWTLTDRHEYDNLQKKGHMLIFEGFYPPARFDAPHRSKASRADSRQRA